MPKSSKVLCHVSQSQLAKSHGSAYVWISDEILAHTFNSFSRCHKRHGSNVPGPLEAQKRAARRRNTSIAYNTTYNPGYQPFEVFGAKPKDGWWDKQLLQANALTLSSSWLWSLLSPQTPLESDRSCQDLEALAIQGEKSQNESVEKVERELVQCLQQTHTHGDLVALLGNTSVNLMQHPQLTQTALKHILEHDWELDQLIEFLLEPQMNPPGSAHFFYLLENFVHYSSTVGVLVQRKVFTRAVTLGLIDVEELKKILMLVPRLTADSSLAQHTFAWASFSMDILSALDRSKVIHIGDLGQSFVIDWLALIKRQHFQPAKAQLLWTLYSYLGHTGRKALRKVVVNSIQTIDKTRLKHIPALANFLLSQPRGHLRDILLPVTQHLLVETAAEYDNLEDVNERDDSAVYRKVLTTTVLEYQKQSQSNANTRGDNGELKSDTCMPLSLAGEGRLDYGILHLNREPSNLELWLTLLRILNVTDLTSFQLKSGFFKTYRDDADIGLEQRQLFVIQLWISMALFDHRRCNLEELTKRKLSSLFSRVFLNHNDGDREDKLTIFIRTMQSLPLPAKEQLLRYTAFACKEHSFGSQTYGILVKNVHDLEHGQVWNLSKTRCYMAARSASPALLSQVAESMNEDMNNFKSTCQSVIRETEEGPVLVSRLLTRNHQLKFVLRQAAILSFSSPLRWENEEAAQKTAIGGYSFNQVVNMVNSFAAECARNQFMSPRDCFKKVFWYYKFLHKCRAPIKPDLLDALWVAGVERYNGSSALEVLKLLYKISISYMGEQRARFYLQRAVIRDRTLDRIAASISRQESKQQVYESGKQMIRPLELPQELGEDEGWSDNSEVSSPVINAGSVYKSKRTYPTGKVHEPNFREAPFSQVAPGPSEVSYENVDNTRHVVLQAKSLHEIAKPLVELGKADRMLEWSSTSKEHMTVDDPPNRKRLECKLVPTPRYPDSTGSLSFVDQSPILSDAKSSISIDDTVQADTKTLSQLSQQEYTTLANTEREGDELATTKHKKDQDDDLQEGIRIDNWLSTQYTTLEARMTSERKEKVKKPGMRRAKLLTWM